MNPLMSISSSGLRFLPLALAYVPAIVLAAQYPNTCTQATATINGILGISGTATFKSIVAVGVQVSVTVKGLQAKEDDLFHIHTNPVFGNNCESTGGHFNPSGASFPCLTPTNQNTCQVGDLSGKGGVLKAQGGGIPVRVDYLDKVINLPTIVGRSVVVHDRLGVKIACGTIQCVAR